MIEQIVCVIMSLAHFIYDRRKNYQKNLNATQNYIIIKMPFIILIDKFGKVKEQKMKNNDDSELYKKAGFKKIDGFAKRHSWDVAIGEDDSTLSNISVYGKTDGSAGRENKYDFPPPIDNVLFFGTVVIVKYDSKHEHIVDLRKADWKNAYETLFGGFENLDDDEDEDDDEEEEKEKEEEKNIDPAKLTKQGYLKDDFVVEDEELEYESELEEEEYFG